MRAGLEYASWKDRPTLAAASQPIYTALSAESARASSKPWSETVHTGTHAVPRTHDGLPLGLAQHLFELSNGLAHLAYRLLAALTRSQRRVDAVTRLHNEFKDCIPTLRGT